MSKQVNMEALYSDTYMENYLDCVENLPNELQVLISRMRQLDVYYLASVREVQNQQENIRECQNGAQKEQMFKRMQEALIAAQELAGEKMNLVQSIQDKIELKKQALDQHFKNLAESWSNGRDVDTAPVETSQNKPVTPEHSLPERQTPIVASSAATGSNQKKTSTAESWSNGRDVDTAPVETSQNKPVTPEHSLPERQTPIVASSAATGSNQKTSTAESWSNGRDVDMAPVETSQNKPVTPEHSLPERQTPVVASSAATGSTQEKTSTAESWSNGRDVDTAPVETSQNKPVTPEHSLPERQTPVVASSATTGSTQKKISTAESWSNGRDVETSQNKPVTPEYSLRKRQTPVVASSAATGSTQKKTSTNKKKIRKSRQSHQTQKEDSPPPEEAASDSDATHCLCDKTSFGEMILCDNDLCLIEWFHFPCVSLKAKPKGKWFCPKCRGGRANVMKRKARFL